MKRRPSSTKLPIASVLCAPLARITLLFIMSTGAFGQVVTITPPNPPAHDGEFGIDLVGIRDIDGDGKGDFVISAGFEDGQTTFTGKVYVYSGGTTPTLIRALDSPNPQVYGGFGTLAILPDITGDGKDEIVVGAAGEDTTLARSGRVYIFSGANAGPPLRTLVSPNPVVGGYFGASVAAAQDMNGDGFAELIVAASAETGTVNGRVYVFSGNGGGLIFTKTSPNAQSDGAFGGTISGIPDLNGDGRGDFIIGARGETVAGLLHAGRAYVYSGADGSLLRTHASPVPTTSGYFGQCVIGIGDINYDGVGDYVIAATYEKAGGSLSGAGKVYVYSGATGQLIRTLISPSPVAGGAFGAVLAAIPDMTGDGLSELGVGARNETQGSPLAYGRYHLFRSDTWTLLQTLSSPNQQVFTGYGFRMAGVPDVNGDGLGETLVAGFGEPLPPNKIFSGRAYLHISPPAPPSPTPSPIPSPSPSPSPTPNAADDWLIFQ